jgi:5,10-methylene-tetrahydrofolate dehydrogenase/methenyl tetrahydrofolate cyclohydrolase
MDPGGRGGRLGRSPIVGRPVAALSLAADRTVTVVTKTRDAAAVCRRADCGGGTREPAMVTAD